MDVWAAYRHCMATEDFFGAHEVLEKQWRQDRAPVWQLAIWWAVLYLHWSRGNWRGAFAMIGKIERQTHASSHLAPLFGPLLSADGQRLYRREPLVANRDLLPFLDRVIAGLATAVPPKMD